MDDDRREEIRGAILTLLHGHKGHIADLAEVLALIGPDQAEAEAVLQEIAAAGSIVVAGDSVFTSSEQYLPKVRCLICDAPVGREDLVPFYREKHFPFTSWGFHRECLEDGALDEMVASGMFRSENGMIYPNYEYGEGKNPITIAIKYLRSDDFLYTLELKDTGG